MNYSDSHRDFRGGAFVLQQGFFKRRAPGIADLAAGCIDHAVAGHNHRQRVFTHRRADRPHGSRLAQLARDIAIGQGLAGFDFQKFFPDFDQK